MKTWEEIALERRKLIVIPEEYKLTQDILETINERSSRSVIDIPALCGILSEAEITITETATPNLLQLLRNGNVSSQSTLLAFYKRALIAHQLCNCLTDIFLEEALETAKYADEYLRKNKKPMGFLHGLPVSFKDCFNIKDHDTTYGYISWCFNVSEEDGAIVQLMKGQGAVPFCKTNLAQGCLLVESTNNVFGTVLNPHNLSLTASGSSGGEAALVALRGSPLGIGTDAGGSVRLPAHSNGVYGYMPTTRRITNKGIGKTSPRGLSWIETQIGPITNDVDTLKIWVEGMIQQDMPLYDFKCCPSFLRKNNFPENLKIGFLYDDNVTDLTPPMKRGLDIVWDKLKDIHKLSVVSVGDLHRRCTEAIFNLYASDGGVSYKSFIEASGEPMVPRVCGTANIEPISRAELNALHVDAEKCCIDYLDFFRKNDLDILITAASPNPASPHSQYSTTSLSAVYNLLGYPAGIIPVGKVDIILDKPTKEYSNRAKIPFVDVRSRFPYDRGDQFIKEELYTDVSKFANAPICIQVVSRKYQDDKLLHGMKVIDTAVNLR